MPSAIVNSRARANPGLRLKLLVEYRRLRSMQRNTLSHAQLVGRFVRSYLVELGSEFARAMVRLPAKYVRIRTFEMKATPGCSRVPASFRPQVLPLSK